MALTLGRYPQPSRIQRATEAQATRSQLSQANKRRQPENHRVTGKSPSGTKNPSRSDTKQRASSRRISGAADHDAPAPGCNRADAAAPLGLRQISLAKSSARKTSNTPLPIHMRDFAGGTGSAEEGIVIFGLAAPIDPMLSPKSQVRPVPYAA